MAPNVPVVDEAVIAQVYTNVRRIHREGHLRLAVAVGAQVVQKLLGGDVERWNEHGQAEPAVKELATRLAADPLEVMSPRSLYRCIGVYELNERVKVLGRQHLTFTHAVAVLGLPENVQTDLLREAEQDKWSTRRLLDEAKELRAANREPSDREPPSRFSRATQRLLKLLSDSAFDELDASAAGAADRIAEAIKRLQAIHAALTGRPAKAEPAPAPSPAPAAAPAAAPVAEPPAPAEPQKAAPTQAAAPARAPVQPAPIDPTLTGLAKAQAAALAYAAAMGLTGDPSDEVSGDPTSTSPRRGGSG